MNQKSKPKKRLTEVVFLRLTEADVRAIKKMMSHSPNENRQDFIRRILRETLIG